MVVSQGLILDAKQTRQSPENQINRFKGLQGFTNPPEIPTWSRNDSKGLSEFAALIAEKGGGLS
jgi:hypothetical protein